MENVINEIWDIYDEDNNQYLDKEETRKFVQDILRNLGSGDDFSQDAFDEIFEKFDEDKSGTIEKDEMKGFINKLIG